MSLPGHRPRSGLLLRAGLIACMFVPCCANTCASTPERAIAHRVGTLDLHAPPATVWSNLRELLELRGYTGWSDAAPVGRTVLSDPRREVSGYSTRVAVRLNPVPDGSILLELHWLTEHTVDGGLVREEIRVSDDEEVRWALLQRTEPARAHEVRAEAEHEADQSRSAWSGCDAFWGRLFSSAARQAERQRQQQGSGPGPN